MAGLDLLALIVSLQSGTGREVHQAKVSLVDQLGTEQVIGPVFQNAGGPIIELIVLPRLVRYDDVILLEAKR